MLGHFLYAVSKTDYMSVQSQDVSKMIKTQDPKKEKGERIKTLCYHGHGKPARSHLCSQYLPFSSKHLLENATH
jgi:hypothetical protein